MSSNPSKIFVGYRALGFVTNHIPLTMRYIRRRKENLVVTVVGRSFHTYSGSKLELLSISKPHPDDIMCLASDANLVFTSCKDKIYAWQRGTELKHVYEGHEKNVQLIVPFVNHLLSVDEDSTLIVWNIDSQDVYLEMNFDNETFKITAMIHPYVYKNKILLGSQQGPMQLWNLSSNKLIYTFEGWDQSITVFEQAPAVDVIAIGLANGDIIIHNLLFDKTIMKFTQEWGPVIGISFRTDDAAVMATASTVGHIAIWDLQERRLHSQIREAHQDAVTGMKFFPDEPLMITSSADNTLKMWIFDLPDGSGRLLKLRAGHAAPPSKIHFHGARGENILSSGLDSSLRSFSVVKDNLNKNLGQASYNRKMAKRKGVKHDTAKMPPITDFTSEITREKEWDNIAACHRGLGIVTTWTYGCCRMGEHKLLHDRFKGQRNVIALCLALSACGNFVVIGYSTGHVDKYNIQSGIYRGSYGNNCAHDGPVRGISTDSLNQLTITGGSDQKIKFWKFKDCHMLSVLSVEETVSELLLHRESGMLAVVLDNFTILIVDIERRNIVRTFTDHGSQITDITFSPDSRWLIVASMDLTIRTWDLPSGKLLDCFLVSSACTSLTMSPTSEYLATAHVDDLGIYLWANCTLYSPVLLQPLPANYQPSLLELPSVKFDDRTEQQTDMEDIQYIEDKDVDMEFEEFTSLEQIAEDLVTLSVLPHSRWCNLLNLDIIKQRNKPKEPPQSMKSAPFFLPVVSGLEPKFAVENTKEKKEEDTRVSIAKFQLFTQFGELIMKTVEDENSWSFSVMSMSTHNLTRALDSGDYERAYTIIEENASDPDFFNDDNKVMSALKEMGPSAIDLEIRSLSPTGGGSIVLLQQFMKVINESLKTRRDFELIQAYLGLFLKVHKDFIISNSELCEFAEIIQETNQTVCKDLQKKFNEALCLVNYLRSAVL